MKFPKLHIATSVVNRILNVADGLPSGAPAMPAPEPRLPNTSDQSALLDAKLESPIGELPGLDQAPDPGATAGGKPLLATMLDAQ
jgi:hypothetical protein